MIVEIVSSLVLILGVFLGEALCSLVFGTNRTIFEVILELVMFIVIMNVILLNIVVNNNLFVQLFLYFFLAFISIITTRSVLFLLFKRIQEVIPFRDDYVNKSNLRLAKLLTKSFSKGDVLRLFQSSGFKKSTIEHLDKVLK
ncbi:Uncharacterised protein [Candidatus Tiddalikarchaeum anstoanum]|nr:Uncharacterised protein [Candidatus Tiddalikarchaeum anstoanum]